MADINRLKVVLVEKKKTSKWLASELKKDPATVSKWCTNTSQPDLPNLPVDVDSWGRSACYPQGNFYPLSDGISTHIPPDH